MPLDNAVPIDAERRYEQGLFKAAVVDNTGHLDPEVTNGKANNAVDQENGSWNTIEELLILQQETEGTGHGGVYIYVNEYIIGGPVHIQQTGT